MDTSHIPMHHKLLFMAILIACALCIALPIFTEAGWKLGLAQTIWALFFIMIPCKITWECAVQLPIKYPPPQE